MRNTIHKFKDTDVKRVIKSALKAGADVAAVRVNPNTGEIAVDFRAKGAEAVASNSWDEVLASEQQEQQRDVRPPPQKRRRRR